MLLFIRGLISGSRPRSYRIGSVNVAGGITAYGESCSAQFEVTSPSAQNATGLWQYCAAASVVRYGYEMLLSTACIKFMRLVLLPDVSLVLFTCCQQPRAYP